MLSPVKIYEDLFKLEAEKFDLYWENLPWVLPRVAPRFEAFVAETPTEYTYGSGRGIRTYTSNPIPDFMIDFWDAVESASACSYELCFCNGYEGNKDHLGWHADDSPEIDDDRPIAVVTFGAERELWFRDKEHTYVDKIKLPSGSMILMEPGMQDTHEHRIPKHSAVCGPRISFTFRGTI